jgi:D-proline reductase (dithiol) PrdB
MTDKPALRIVRADELEAKFQQWRGIVDQMHATTRFTPNDTLAWAPLTKPLRQCIVALVSTAGVHLRSGPDFNLMDEYGDPSFRAIPGDTRLEDIAVSHSHFDTADANADPNVVFPLDRLRELAAEGTIGAVAPLHIGMMGWNPDGERVRHDTAPQVARRLRAAWVDVVVLIPG